MKIENKTDIVKKFVPIIELLDLKVSYHQETEILVITDNTGNPCNYIFIGMDSNKDVAINIIKGLKEIICDDDEYDDE